MKGNKIFWMVVGGLLLVAPSWAGPYTTTGDEVTDQRTGLVWQGQSDGQRRDWQGAIAYCEGLLLAYQSVWRVPNIKELDSISDINELYFIVNPSADRIFDGTNSDNPDYWSSTTYASNSSRAWVVDSFDGFVGPIDKSTLMNVRCVRGGQ